MCPGAPFLLDGSAGALARQVPDLLVACRTAVGTLRDAEVILLVSTGRKRNAAGPSVTAVQPPQTRLLRPGTALRASGFVRSDRTPQRLLCLPGGERAGDPPAQVTDPAVGTVVGTFLLAQSAVEVPVTAVEITGSGAAAAVALAAVADDRHRAGLLVMADGAACHGESAPGRRNDAAGPFDGALARALADGDPDGLATACSDDEAARELLATVEPLAALATLTRGHRPDRARVLYSGAPFGVGYLVSQWQWS